MINPATGKEWTAEEVKAEIERCKDDPYYFYEKYWDNTAVKVTREQFDREQKLMPENFGSGSVWIPKVNFFLIALTSGKKAIKPENVYFEDDLPIPVQTYQKTRMPNLNAFTTIHTKVKKYKQDYELESLSYAFSWLWLETLFNLNDDEITDTITEGPNDGGFDAVYINEEGREVHIFNFKYAETFDKSKNTFPGSECSKVIVTSQKISDKSLKKDEVNELVWEKAEEIWDLFEKGTVNFKFHLCSNKEKLTSTEQKSFENSLLFLQYVEFFYYDQMDVQLKILEKKYKKINGSIRFHDKQYFERSDGNLRGIVATIAAPDLIHLIIDPENPNKLNENAFNENVRIYLKRKDNKINQGIYDASLSEDNFNFWYLNNGINIVCEKCSFQPIASPKVELKNIQIVNGGQTTHALFEAYLADKTKLDNVRLVVRICETTSPKISELISETTNKQTPVRTRDLHSNDTIQRTLEEQFKTMGYFYESKKNKYENEPKNKRLNNELLGQIFLAYYLQKPSEARQSKERVFGDLYDQIFNEDYTTAENMLIPYKFYLPLEKIKQGIQKKKRKKEPINERDAFVSRAIFHVLTAIRLVVKYEKIDVNDESKRNNIINKAIKYIGEIVSIESRAKGDKYNHDRFFKEIRTNKVITQHILRKHFKDQTITLK